MPPPPHFMDDAQPSGKPREYRKLLKSFCKYYRNHLPYLYIGLASMIVSTVVTMFIPLLTYRIFDTYLKNEDISMVVWASAALLGMALLLAAAEFIGINWGHKLGIRMETDMRADMFSHLQKLSFNYFDRNKTGHIMSRLTNDLNQIAELAHHGPETLLRSTLTIVGSFCIMLWLNWLLTLITVLPLPLIIFWGAIFRGRMHSGFRDVRKKIADINSQVENSIQGIREVKSFTNEENEISRFRNVNDLFLRAREAVYRTMAFFHSGIMLMIQSYSLIYVVAGAVLMFYHRATLLEVMTFMMYARYFTMPVFQLLGFMEQFQMGYAAYERFVEVMDEAPDIADPEGAVASGRLRGEIDVRHVFFRYPRAALPP
ncbi:MAG: ABC transporter ATP-binding protein, partial [Planctomycetes bacterium]|nr:ABC transporter ATP-binding protein [Planctomycetota bacterium]